MEPNEAFRRTDALFSQQGMRIGKREAKWRVNPKILKKLRWHSSRLALPQLYLRLMHMECPATPSKEGHFSIP